MKGVLRPLIKKVLVCCTPNIFSITKTSPCNEDPLTPHFYIGFTGVYIIFLIFARKHRFLGTR